MKPSEVRILVVDDDQMMLETISELFKVFHFHVDTATSGNQAWELAQKRNYNLVISDIRMPEGDGIELAIRLKQLPVKPSILFISGFSEIMTEEIYHIGVEGIFAKPFDASAVKRAIQSSLLTLEAKWSRAADQGPLLPLKKIGASLEELQRQKSVLFGRGGFFFAHNYVLPQKGTQVAFHIEVSTPKPILLSGVGVVRWAQAQEKQDAPAGLGIEILSMPAGQARDYVKTFGQVEAFIPAPRKSEFVKKSA